MKKNSFTLCTSDLSRCMRDIRKLVESTLGNKVCEETKYFVLMACRETAANCCDHGDKEDCCIEILIARGVIWVKITSPSIERNKKIIRQKINSAKRGIAPPLDSERGRGLFGIAGVSKKLFLAGGTLHVAFAA